jgi:DUF917 family protein
MRTLSATELRDVAVGSAVLGTGGGGDPHLGRLVAVRACEEYRPPSLVTPDELDDDHLVVLPFLIGSPVPIIEKISMGHELGRAFHAINRFLEGRVKAVMPIEIGGVNSMVPFALGALEGLPVVDGDCMGRAFPEVQLVTFTLYGISAAPMSVADERGNTVVFATVDNTWAEKFGRSVCVDMGAIACATGYPVTIQRLKEAAILGSLSYAEGIGRAIRRAKEEKADPVEAVLDVTTGRELFRGKIVDVQRRVTGGWAKGWTVLEGFGDFEGTQLKIDFQNENLVAIRDGQLLASVPDLISVLELETGEPITTEALRYGFRVVVLGIPCDAKWRSEAGVALAGPRHFGYDLDYVPLAAPVLAGSTGGS